VGFRAFGGCELTYIAYLDEFGHIGPYIDRNDAKFKESPVFGLAGLVLPMSEVRGFGTWFFQRKCELLDFEIKRAGVHPAIWEKKGASLYTVANVTRYRELRNTTNRLFNKIETIGGFVFYVGIQKNLPPDRHNPNFLYHRVLLEAIKRIDSFCAEDCDPKGHFILALDEHDQRQNLITAAARSMYGADQPRKRLIEPPFQLESHRYQTLQAADWIAGLVGRIGAYWCDRQAYADFKVFSDYFEHRLHRAAKRSGIRTNTPKPAE
jgi:hypothetical protein